MWRDNLVVNEVTQISCLVENLALVCRRSLAMADAEAVVQELLGQVKAERGLDGPVEIRVLNSGGGNYTSALFTASINDLKLFAKVAIIGEKMRAIMNAETLFKTEQIVYSELVKIYSDLKKHKDVSFRFPKVYASLPDLGRESVVMEDLSAQGYKTPSRHDPIDWKFASAAVAKLAQLHALSFTYEKEHPEEFGQMAERLKYISQNNKVEKEESVKAAWESMIGNAVQVVKEDHRTGLVKLLSDIEGFTKFRKPLSRTVLAHGDYRTSNMMFKEQDNGSLEIIVVDYQTFHSGCPVSDLLYFIFLGTDQEFRRKHYEELVGLYHRELSVALDGLGVDVEKVYPKEVFEKEVKKMLGPALQMAAVILPLVVVDEAAAPQVAGDADIKGFAIAPNEMFAKRFAALVEDCVDWGVI